MRAIHKTAPSKSLFGFVFFFLKKQWIKLLVMQFLWFAWSLDQTVFPLLFGKIIDGFTNYVGLRAEAWPVLSAPILAAMGLWVGIEISFRLGGILMANVFPKLEKQIRMYMFSHMQDQSQAYFSTHFAGNISTKISDMVDNMNHVLNLIITLFLPMFLAVIISTVIFYQLSPFFAMVLIGWALIHMGIGIMYASRCTYYSTIHSETRSQLNGRIVDSLTNYFAVKIFSNKKYELNFVGELQKQEQKQNKQQLVYIEKVRVVLGILSFLGPGLGLNGYAYWCWTHHLVTVGDIVLVFNTSWNIIMMLWWASIELPNFFKGIGVCQQALSLLQAPITLVDAPQAKELSIRQGKIQFQKVHFQYPNMSPLFSNKSILIKPGQKVGLVGYSGSGKTTFVNLILRLFDIQSGQILIDDQDIAGVTQDSLRKAISFIPQDPTLFHRTLLDNIRYGKPDAFEEDVIVAAQKAHAHEFIMTLPQEYHTPVGERGMKLSGGQRQRISIARAILKNAPILILDEATSALDSFTEANIQDSLSTLMTGKTTMVIAHRLSTLLNMDRILVFDRGKIVEDGTHEALLAKQGLYHSLWEAQVGGFLPDGAKDSEA
ncbi:MAG: ABC transporter ATP-binding protein [Alphaproteobacteria bacterium]|nr:ABC transporter ATP-binding protein [Alphaproteobacteria bacterium]MBP7729134.1 ABC transporter ATP-binding protein [Alphaproteobacteria bacterium]